MRVIKFGGSSLANAQRFLAVSEIIINKSKQSPIAVVVSAPQGITNHLVALTENLAEGEELTVGLDHLLTAINHILMV